MINMTNEDYCQCVIELAKARACLMGQLVGEQIRRNKINIQRIQKAVSSLDMAIAIIEANEKSNKRFDW